MNILDSSAWLELFTGGKNTEHFISAIKKLDQLIVPTITIYEVGKKLLLQYEENKCMEYISQMQKGTVVDLDYELSILAAALSQEYHLAMADSIILATAQTHNATIWTQDSDFKNIKGVKYFKKG